MTPRRDPLEELDRRLAAIRFEPRPSLGPEILWRLRRTTAPVSRTLAVRRILSLGIGSVAVGASLVAGLLSGDARTTARIDQCCADLDGGGEADDGLLVVADDDEQVQRLAVYEDRDRSGTLTWGDEVRFERLGHLSLVGRPDSSYRMREFCCLDYDGGGQPDDALIVMGLPPDRIAMAAIYQRGRAHQPELK
jgi:hypothetical protein